MSAQISLISAASASQSLLVRSHSWAATHQIAFPTLVIAIAVTIVASRSLSQAMNCRQISAVRTRTKVIAPLRAGTRTVEVAHACATVAQMSFSLAAIRSQNSLVHNITAN